MPSVKRAVANVKGTLEQVGLLTVESERDAKLGFACARHSVREDWLLQGRLGEEDPFPWLRTAQVQGLEVVIVGCTMDAVRVCNEALHAGFKAVLIIMEDQVRDERVFEWLGAMAVHSWSRHPFRNGPVLISSDSSSCMVRLDDEGAAVDVYVRTNISGVLTNAEAWQYFRGPVIVVDSVEGGGPASEEEEAEATMSRRLTLSMLIKQEEQKRTLGMPEDLSEQEGRELECPEDSPMEHMQARLTRVRGAGRREPTDGKTSAWGCRMRDSGDVKTSAEDLTAVLEEAGLIEGVKLKFPSESSEPKQEDLNQMRRRFIAKTAAERSAVINPRFWQERYDPERFGFQMVAFRLAWMHSLIGCLASLSISLEGTVHNYQLIQVMRVCVRLAFMTPAWLTTAIFCSSLLGFVARSHPNNLSLKASLVTLAVYLVLGHVEVGGHCITQFASCTVTMAVLLLSLATLAHRTRGLGVSRHNLRWSAALMALIWVSMVLAMLLALLFLALASVSGYLAAAYLWPTATLFEHCLCHCLRAAYYRLVWQPRQRGEEVFGEQRGALSVAAMAMLGCMEVGKCAALLAGTIQFNRIAFLPQALTSMAIGLVLNTSIRSGWLCSFLALRLPRCRSWLCPDSLTIFLQDCRGVVWWTQPALFLGMMWGRGLVTGNWSIPTMETEATDVWCWGMLTLMVYCFIVVRNLLEDWFIVRLATTSPAPLWEAFGPLMQQRLDRGAAAGTSDPYHPIHFLSLHPNLVMTKTGQLTSEFRSERDSAEVVRLPAYSENRRNDRAPRILASPHFKHTREARHYQLFFAVSVQWSLYYMILTLALGMPNFHGACHPSPLTDAGDVLRRLVLVETVDRCPAPGGPTS